MSSDSLIIGITGTIGAGKGEAVNYLVQNCGFRHYSVRDFVVRELTKRNMPLDRPAMQVLSNELRNTHGGDYIVKKMIEEASMSGGDAIIESIRAQTEADYIKGLPHSFLLGIDAPASVRYERILKRGSVTDHITFEEFLAQEGTELTSQNPNNQNLQYCLQVSDAVVENDSSLEKFYEKIDAVMHRFRQTV